MLRKMPWIVPLALLVALPAQAQDPRIELRGWAGYTYSDGVSGNTYEADDGNLYSRVDPDNSLSYGGAVGFMLTENENVEFGLLWDRQETVLVAKGEATREISNLDIDNYHGYIAYNFGYGHAPLIPYLLAGLGVTRYSAIRVTGDAQTLDLPAKLRFSTTWGAGIKIYPVRNVGIFGGVRWTPTQIKSDVAGWWCDPWWGGCWVDDKTQYSTQWEFEGGLNLRF